MKRDMDLIRKILLKVEGISDNQPGGLLVSVDGYDDHVFARHVELIKEAGLVEAQVLRASGAGAVKAQVNRLTWDGYDFLDAIRSDSIWDKTKAGVAQTVGSAPLEVLKALAISLIKTALEQAGFPAYPANPATERSRLTRPGLRSSPAPEPPRVSRSGQSACAIRSARDR